MRLCFVLLLLQVPTLIYAQSDEFGMWYSAGVEKKINKKMSVGVESEYRMRENMQEADRWSIGAAFEYKFVKWLKASAGYDFLWKNNREKVTYKSSGAYNNTRPSYWSARHRVHVDLTGNVDVGRFNFSLRERWQYTYRPGTTTTRYDHDNGWWEDTYVHSKGGNVLRSRLQAEYNIPSSHITPYASVELFNSWNLDKVRYTVGADWNIQKKHTVGLFYRYQDVNSDDDDDPNQHIVGLSYKFKF